MKFQFNFIVKFLSLTILLSIVVFGLNAQKKYPNLLASNTNLYTQQNLPKTISVTPIKQEGLDSMDVIEEKQKLEGWMFDSKFWQNVQKSELEEEALEEPDMIEDWIKIFKVQKAGCLDIYSDFVEKDWMKQHSFFIL